MGTNAGEELHHTRKAVDVVDGGAMWIVPGRMGRAQNRWWEIHG